jgi:hypothetical protein
LKRSNLCPLCKHDLTEDINKMHWSNLYQI